MVAILLIDRFSTLLHKISWKVYWSSKDFFGHTKIPRCLLLSSDVSSLSSFTGWVGCWIHIFLTDLWPFKLILDVHICPLTCPGPSAQTTYAWSSGVRISPLPPGLQLCSREGPLWGSPDHSHSLLPTQHQIQMLLKHRGQDLRGFAGLWTIRGSYPG